MRFRGDLHTRDGEPGEFILTQAFGCELLPGVVLEVPIGFVTDFASIPAALQWMPGFDVNGRSRRAAVVHDFLYSAHGRVDLRTDAGGTIRVSYKRSVCDRIFREALIASGVVAAVAWPMYLGVRAGGWVYWQSRALGLRADDFGSP